LAGELIDEGVRQGFELHQIIDLHLDREQVTGEVRVSRAREAKEIATYLLE
jgi:hypothetical protein